MCIRDRSPATPYPERSAAGNPFVRTRTRPRHRPTHRDVAVAYACPGGAAGRGRWGPNIADPVDGGCRTVGVRRRRVVIGVIGRVLGCRPVCRRRRDRRSAAPVMTGLARISGTARSMYRNHWTDQSRRSWTSSGDCVEMRTGHSASKRDFLDCSNRT